MNTTDTIVIVEQDLERVAERVRAVVHGYRAAESHERTARDAFALQRLHLGTVLSPIRKRWPSRGPNAKGWGAFLRSVDIDEDTALIAIKYAAYVARMFPQGIRENLPTLRDAGLDK